MATCSKAAFTLKDSSRTTLMYGPDKVPLSKSPKAGQKVANMKVLSFSKRSMNTNRNWRRLGVLCTKKLRWFRWCYCCREGKKDFWVC